MPDHIVLALDFGTSFCKCYANDGIRGLAEARHPIHVRHPSPEVSEFDPEDWKEAAVMVMKQVSDLLGDKKNAIVALVASTSGPGIILSDDQGNALLPSPNWQDARCAEEGQFLFNTIGAEWVGQGIPQISNAARLLWYERHCHDTLSHAARIQDNKGFVLSFLTGNRYTDVSCSGRVPYDWVEDLIPLTCARKEQFDEVLPIEGVAGVLKNELCQCCALPEGIPVIAGLNDGAAAVLGAGAIIRDAAIVSISTNGVARTLVGEKPSGEWLKNHGLFCTKFVDDLWVLGGMTKTAGDSAEWLGELMFQDVETASRLSAISEAASRVPCGAEGLLYIPGIYGLGSPTPGNHPCGAFLNAARSHRREHFARAVLEGVGYAIRTIGETISDNIQAWPEVWCTGGGSKSLLWVQIIADILNHAITPSNADSLLGAAIVGAKASGIYNTYEEAAREMAINNNPVVYPSVSNFYLDYYRSYCNSVQMILNRGDTENG